MFNHTRERSPAVKAHPHRTQKEEKVDAVSPYQSRDELTQYDEEDVDAVENLSSKHAQQRLDAMAQLYQMMSKNVVTDHASSNIETILQGCTRTFTTRKTQDTEKQESIRLGAAVMLARADDHPMLYNEWALALYSLAKDYINSHIYNVTVAKSFRCLAVLYAADQCVTINETQLCSSLLDPTVFPMPHTVTEDEVAECVAAYALCLVRCCERRNLQDVVAFVMSQCLSANDNHATLVAGGFQCVAIINEKFPGTFNASTVAQFRQLATDAEGRQAKKELFGLFQRVIKSLESGEQPEEKIVMRHGQFALIKGFSDLHLLELIREILGEGTQHHLVTNSTVRRLFRITENFSGPANLLVQERAAERAKRSEAKEELSKARGQERDQKVHEVTPPPED